MPPGNRVSKAVTSGGTTTTTHYLRDASGIVMAIYKEITGGSIAFSFDPNWQGPKSSLEKLMTGFGEMYDDLAELAEGETEDAEVAGKMISGIAGVALAIPSMGTSLSFIGGGSLLFSSNSLASGVTDAVDEQDKDRNLLREGSELIGGETGGQVYDYTEFGFGLFSIGLVELKVRRCLEKEIWLKV